MEYCVELLAEVYGDWKLRYRTTLAGLCSNIANISLISLIWSLS